MSNCHVAVYHTPKQHNVMAKLLFTGASGFLGNSVCPLLQKEYEIVHTLGLSAEDYVRINLASSVPNLDTRYDIVLHACGKAHLVPKTEAERKAFYDVNYQGTVNLCTALEKSGMPKSFIFVSTVAVYGCESGEMISEDHPLNGNTPYAESKKMAEEYLTEWCAKHDVILSIIRPSLIAGVNAPGNLGAMVKGIKTGRYLSINHGKARKSVLMAEDIARLIPRLAEVGGIYNVCDSHNPTFGELEHLIATQLNKKDPVSIPYWFANCLALCGNLLGSKAPINSLKLKKITESLTFSNEKARKALNWEPLDVLHNYKI